MALRRFLVLGEETDLARCPDDYALVQAAKYLGVAPWELMEQSVWWKARALKFMRAEAEAQQQLQEQAEAKARTAQANGRY